MIHFVNSGYNNAAYNMALDEYLLTGGPPFTLTVYGWSRPTLSLGYAQRAHDEIALDKLAEAGCVLVRRLTGGRAVLHDAEITYSVTADIGGPFGDDLNSAYLAIARGLQATLRHLGVDADIEKGSSRDVRERQGASLPCFASVSRHEITVQGKKLIGSAQRREKNRFLQHGSLLLEERMDMTQFLRTAEDKKQVYREVLQRESITLNQIVSPALEYADFVRAFQVGFSEAFGMEVAQDHDCSASCDALRELEAKYSSDEWTFRL